MSLPRAAIAGLGFMGRTHLQSLRRLGVEVAGVLGSSPEKGQEFAGKYHLGHVYRDYEELIADPQVEVVHICTPNALHYPMAKAAFLAGKHVVCEKPLAMDSRESRELVELAQSRGLAAVVNYNLRYYPLCQEARARFQAGEIGEPRLAFGGYIQDWLFLPTDWNWRLESQAGGEVRAVGDIGTHWMDMVTWITGVKIVEVMADLAAFYPVRQKPLHPAATFDGKLVKDDDTQPYAIDTEDIALILLRFENGARGSLTLSQISAGRKNNFWWEISGSQASIRWDQENPNSLWLGYRDRPNEILIKDPALMHVEARAIAEFPGGHAEGYPDTFYQLYKDVYEALTTGKPLDVSRVPLFEEGHCEMLLCEAILRSARERRWVEVEKG